MIQQLSRRLILGVTVIGLCFVFRFLAPALGEGPNLSFPLAEAPPSDTAATAAPEAGAPADAAAAPAVEQSYVGTNQCFVCHRPQTDTWSETKHVHAFTNLPEKYQSDGACLPCHVTGFGKPGGYVAGTEKDLLMVGCEACHGPGARHIDAAKRFVLATPGEEEKIEKELRTTIIKTPTDDVCAACHVVQAHHNHPKYEGQPAGQPAEQDGSGSTVRCVPAGPMVWPSAHSTFTVSSSSKYTVKTCGGCHYGQYEQWHAGAHFNLAKVLPAQLTNGKACQQCHPSAGTAAQIPSLGSELDHNWLGVACESCHGPALEHVRFNKRFISSPPLGPKLEQAARHSIDEGKPGATCIQCHIHERHGQHPQVENN